MRQNFCAAEFLHPDEPYILAELEKSYIEVPLNMKR
jgi:hypothetical protein